MSKKATKTNTRVLSEIYFNEDLSDSELGNIEFEILSAGKKIYRGGELIITENDLGEMEKHFTDNVVGTELAVDVNHDDDHRAVFWFKTVRKVGDKLMATFKDFSDEGRKFLLQKQYRYFSVEFENGFQKLIDGVTQTFNNVLRGVALTNRPVDKNLAPTFMSEQLNSLFNHKNMDTTLKALSVHLLAKDKLTLGEKTLWKDSVLALEEEEQKAEEVVETTTEIEAKPDAEVVDEEAAKKAEEEKVQAEKEKKEAEEAAAKSEEEKAELSEKNKTTETKLAELQSELSKVKTERRKEKLSEKCINEIQLSETIDTGLNKEDTPKFSDFLATLSDIQAETVLNFVKKVKHVDFTEHGDAGAGDVDTDKTNELTKLAEAKMKEDSSLTLGEATKRVLSEKPELGENL